MEHVDSRDFEALKMAEYFTPATTIIDSETGEHYHLRKFLWMGNWGVCNAEKTKKIVKAKANYTSVDILVYAQQILAGSPNTGWDIYSLKGEFLQYLAPMSRSTAASLLDAKRRNAFSKKK